MSIDATHSPDRRSWVESAQGSDFPIQNLPWGVFRRDDADRARIGVAIGDRILDVAGAVDAALLGGLDETTTAALVRPTLNALLALGVDAWRAARHAIADLLDVDAPALRDRDDLRARLLIAADEVEMRRPVEIGDYTDFYASIHHATNVGSMFRPDNPLLPNYRHLPVGYHGRASTVVPSGTPVRRPCGQTMADGAAGPTFGPSRLLDYELELGFLVGPGNPMGTRLSMADASRRIFGVCIVNDWSARDVQKWEYQPLGPFNAKNFATTMSPWIVTLDALAPFRVPGPPRGAADPPILDYLKPVDDLALDLTLEVHLASAAMRDAGTAPVRVSRGGFADMYWTIGQMLVHHTSTGCAMRPGDLLASGTVSGPEPEARGCLLERTWRGRDPVILPDGTERRFLADGDEVTMTGWAERDGAVRIGLGTCAGVVIPAVE